MKDRAQRKNMKRLERMGQCGIWISLTPHKLNGTLLSQDKWLDSSRFRNGFRPMGLCSHCDGCSASFSVEHRLSCKKGDLVSIRHDDARDRSGALVALALTASKVTYEPMITYGRNQTACQPSAPQGTGNALGEEARGDVLIHGLWKRGSGCVLDIRITDTDGHSYLILTSKNVLERAAKAKKDKYLQHCLDRRRSFTLLIYSVDGMACKLVKAFEKRITCLHTEKWDCPYSELVGYVGVRMGMAIIRSNTLLLRGWRVNKRTVPWIWDNVKYEAVQERSMET